MGISLEKNELSMGVALKILDSVMGIIGKKAKRQLDTELIRQRKRKVIERFGEWTAHNIMLSGDLYTIGNRIAGDEIKLKRIIQVISDISGKPLESLRILDLACLEGLYSIELALHGAQVVAIEGRAPNIEKARFASDMLSLNNLELHQDDVRNLNKERYGYFDVVLCLGILYHLDVPDVFAFVQRISEVCKRFVIIDTHISLKPAESFQHNGKTYWGSSYVEHSADSTTYEREVTLWASLDNLKSFWFTRNSLYNLLLHAGFTSVYECHNPPETEKPCNRITLLAMKGNSISFMASPLLNGLPEAEWPADETICFTDDKKGL